LIEALQLQAEEKTTSRDEAMVFHDEELENARGENEDKIKVYDDMIEKLTAAIKTAQAEVKTLHEGTHDKHKALENARAAISKTIAQHENIVKNMRAALALNEQQTAQKIGDQKGSWDEFNVALQALAEQKEKLLLTFETTDAARLDSENKLKTNVAGSAEEMTKLEQTLSQGIETLRRSISDADEIRAKQVVVNGEFMKSMKQSHSEAYKKSASEVSSIQQELQTAQRNLEYLKAAHLSDIGN